MIGKFSIGNSYNKLIRAAIQQHYTTEIHNNQGNSKHIWKVINNLAYRGKKSSHVGEIRNKHGETFDTNDIPNAFNSHFISLKFYLTIIRRRRSDYW